MILADAQPMRSLSGEVVTAENFARDSWQGGTSAGPAGNEGKMTREEVLKLLKLTDRGDGAGALEIGDK